MPADTGYPGRYSHTNVALLDGNIILLGGYDGISSNDMWRSTDQGATWMQMIADAEWTVPYEHTSVVLPDSSVVLMGDGYICYWTLTKING